MIKALFIAWKNFRCKKGVMIKLISCFFVIICSVSCFFNYTVSANGSLEHIIKGSAAKAFVETDSSISSSEYPLISEKKEITRLEPAPLKYITLTVDGKEYRGMNDYSYDFSTPFSVGTAQSVYSVPFIIDAYNSEEAVFTRNDIQEYKVKFGDKSPEIAGEAVLSSDSIIFTDYMLEKFGLSPESSLIGSEMSLYNTETGEVYCEGLKLSCILDSDVFRISSVNRFGQIIIPSGQEKAESGDYVYYNYAKDYLSAYELANKLSADNVPHYVPLELYYYSEIYKQDLIVSKVVFMIMIVFLLAMAVSAVTVLYFYHCNQLDYRRMLLAMGLKVKELFLTVLTEITLCISAAYILAIAASGAVMFLISKYLVSRFEVEEMFSMTRLVGLSSLTAAVIFVAAICFSAVSSGRIKRELK